MKADFTRNTFHPSKHFTRVLMQQGRVQLDADWNEQAAILTRYLRSLAADIIGSHGGPSANLGFSILPLQYSQIVGNDFAISDGHYYVDGILCENDSTPVAIFAPQGVSANSLSATVEVWSVDSASFQKGQYLQICDAANPANLPPPIPPNTQQSPLIAVVSNTNQASRSLTLTADPVGIGWINSWINLPSAMPRVRHFLTYTTQPDYPGQAKLSNGTYHVYLDVWERLITSIEDDNIREVALGGPDNAARAKLIAQVKVSQDSSLSPPPPATCATPMALSALFQPYNRGLLKARVRPSAASMDPCIISPTSSYRGPENQLYRVEIHTSIKDALGNTAKPTFKWSRENGSVVFPILSGFGTTVLTLETLGRDDRFGLAEGDWVEVQDDDYVLLNRAGTLLQVLSIDRTNMQVTLNAAADPAIGKDPSKHSLLRRWDQKQGDEADGGVTLNPTDNAVTIQDKTGENSWLELEDGIQIQFQPSDLTTSINQYRTGDYWLIPARTATGDIEWPTELVADSQGNLKPAPIPLPPAGVMHHYAPLAVITVLGDTSLPTLTSCQVPLQALKRG